MLSNIVEGYLLWYFESNVKFIKDKLQLKQLRMPAAYTHIHTHVFHHNSVHIAVYLKTILKRDKMTHITKSAIYLFCSLTSSVCVGMFLNVFKLAQRS